MQRIIPHLFICAVALLPGVVTAQYAGGAGQGYGSGSRASAHISYFGAHTLSGTAGTRNDSGWRMLSSPVTSATRADLSDDVNLAAASGSAVYLHDGTGFVPVSSDATALQSGRGFILYLYDDAVQTVTAAGLELDFAGDPPVIDVQVGSLGANDQWHLLGNPFDIGLDLSALDLISSGFQAAVQVWNPRLASWQTVTQDPGTGDVLAAMQGFLAERSVLGSGQTSLTIPFSGRTLGGTLVGGKRSAAAPVLPLTLKTLDETGRELAADRAATLYFHESAEENWDPWDATRVHLPVSEEEAVLAFPGLRGETLVDQVQRSHPVNWKGRAEFPLAVRAPGAPAGVEISWPSLELLPADWQVYLVDKQRTGAVDLRLTESYRLGGVPTDGRLKLVVLSSADDAFDADESQAFHLAQVFPNPFSQRATIEIRLEDPAAIRLSIYDVLGRRVAVLVDETLSAGVHTVDIDGTGLSPGVYACVLEGDGRRESRTLVRVP